MNTSELLLKAINAGKIKSNLKNALHHATASLRKAVLSYDSDTDENKYCAEDLEFGFGETYDDIPVLSLKRKVGNFCLISSPLLKMKKWLNF